MHAHSVLAYPPASNGDTPVCSTPTCATFGQKKDSCGVCGGPGPKSGYDCNGVCLNPDCKGVCFGTAKRDCKYQCEGTAKLDECNVCGGSGCVCTCFELVSMLI